MTDEFTDRHLIFLVSQPRAGSTLLQSLLAGVEGIHTTAEPWLMLHALYGLRETGHTAEYDAVVAARALSDFLGQLHNGADAYYRAVRRMGLALYGQACREAGKSMFLDKTPRYYRVLPELRRVFPEARFVILLRNPAAVLSSIVRTWVGDDWSRFSYFRDDLLLAPRCLVEYVAQTGPETTVVQYESLIAEPEACLRDLCARLDLPFHPRLLDYGTRPLPAGRYGDPTGIRQHDRPSLAPLDSWLTHAADPQVHHLLAAYLDTLGTDLIAQMGYSQDELRVALDRVARRPGRPRVTWSQLMRTDRTFGDRVLLTLRGGSWRRPRQVMKRAIRLWDTRKAGD